VVGAWTLPSSVPWSSKCECAGVNRTRPGARMSPCARDGGNLSDVVLAGVSKGRKRRG
jgi:hypothetical protein